MSLTHDLEATAVGKSVESESKPVWISELRSVFVPETVAAVREA